MLDNAKEKIFNRNLFNILLNVIVNKEYKLGTSKGANILIKKIEKGEIYTIPNPYYCKYLCNYFDRKSNL